MIETDVLVVGAGPAGLATAIALLATLAGAWVLIGAYLLHGFRKKKRANNH